MQPPEFPFIPGMDICGVVEEVVSTSDDFKVGPLLTARFAPPESCLTHLLV